MSARLDFGFVRSHTLVLGHRSYFSKQLNKVREVIAKELRSNDKVFTGVEGGELGT